MLEDLLQGEYMEKGEPFYNKVDADFGVLMFHGLAATPDQVRELGDFFYKQGIPNFGACIAGHGTKEEDLAKTSRKDWLDSARTAYEEFNKVYPKTIVLGFSMGGLLALNIGQEYKPRGIITISTPYELNIKGNLLAILGFHKTHPENMIGYQGMPLRSKYEIIRLVKETHKAIKEIDDPILIIQGTDDRRVSKKSPYQIFDNVKSRHRDLFVIPGEHIILKGNYKFQIFNNIHQFVLHRS